MEMDLGLLVVCETYCHINWVDVHKFVEVFFNLSFYNIALYQGGYWSVIDDTVKLIIYMKLTLAVSSNKTQGSTLWMPSSWTNYKYLYDIINKLK